MTGDIETYNMYESIPIKINHPLPVVRQIQGLHMTPPLFVLKMQYVIKYMQLKFPL